MTIDIYVKYSNGRATVVSELGGGKSGQPAACFVTQAPTVRLILADSKGEPLDTAMFDSIVSWDVFLTNDWLWATPSLIPAAENVTAGTVEINNNDYPTLSADLVLDSDALRAAFNNTAKVGNCKLEFAGFELDADNPEVVIQIDFEVLNRGSGGGIEPPENPETPIATQAWTEANFAALVDAIDMVFASGAGPVITDKVDGKKYRIVFKNGKIGREEVTS